MLITARTLYRCDVKTEDITGLVGTLNVDWRLAMIAADTSSAVLFASSANLRVLGSVDQWDALNRGKRFGIAKLDFRGPNRASNMHPIVVCSPLQGFARVDGSVQLLLLLPIVFGSLDGILSLLAFTLTLLFGLLLMGILGWPYKIMLRFFNRAKDALVALQKC